MGRAIYALYHAGQGVYYEYMARSSGCLGEGGGRGVLVRSKVELFSFRHGDGAWQAACARHV